MLGEWPEATEAALSAEYGGNPLGDFWRGEVSLRRLRVMVENLPPGSAWHRAHPGNDGWTAERHLLADIKDDLARLIELTRAANSEDSTFHGIDPVERPGMAEARAAQEAEAAASSARLNEMVDLLMGGD